VASRTIRAARDMKLIQAPHALHHTLMTDSRRAGPFGRYVGYDYSKRITGKKDWTGYTARTRK